MRKEVELTLQVKTLKKQKNKKVLAISFHCVQYTKVPNVNQSTSETNPKQMNNEHIFQV